MKPVKKKLTKEEKEIRGNQSKLNSISSRNKANKTFNSNPNKKQILIDRGKSISNSKSKIEFKENFSKIAKNNWKSEEYRKKMSEITKKNWTLDDYRKKTLTRYIY